MSDLVMVIEDEKEIRDLIRYNLEREGFRVSAVADGEEGLRRLFASRPDAVVLDLMLPGRSGLDVLREVRGEPATSDLPVLVLTARSADWNARPPRKSVGRRKTLRGHVLKCEQNSTPPGRNYLVILHRTAASGHRTK